MDTSTSSIDCDSVQRLCDHIEGEPQEGVLRGVFGATDGFMDAFLSDFSTRRVRERRQIDDVVWDAYTAYLDIGTNRTNVDGLIPLMYLTPEEAYLFEALEAAFAGVERLALPVDDGECAAHLMSRTPTTCLECDVAAAVEKFKELGILQSIGSTSGDRQIFRLTRTRADAVILHITHRPAVPVHDAYRQILRDIRSGAFEPRGYVESMRNELAQWLRRAHPEVHAATTLQKMIGFHLASEGPNNHGWGLALIVDPERPTLLVATEGFEAICMAPSYRSLRVHRKTRRAS